MDIESVSSNTFVQQITGVQSTKQTHQVNQTDDTSFSATLQSSQNIGNNSIRKIEQSTENNAGSGVDEKEESKGKGETKQFLDILV